MLEGQQQIPPEKLTNALRFNGQRIFTGLNHGLALDTLKSEYPDWENNSIEEGYVTATGKFLSRKEAKAIRVVDESDEHVRRHKN